MMPALTLLAVLVQHQHTSPYAAEAAREIKALSPGEVESLLEGRGMGLARAAELNRYPGPLHVLELAEALALTPEQRRRTQQAREAMLEEARALGAAIVEQERGLDRLFATGQADDAAVTGRVSEIARLQGALRTIHLRAHLEMRRVLSPQQIERYAVLRGY
jgi:hypothetical protein